MFLSDSIFQANFKELPCRHRRKRETSSYVSKLVNISCAASTSCVGKCRTKIDPGSNNNELKCFCDDHCALFHDCCADYEQVCLSNIRHNSSRSLNVKLWKCISGGNTKTPKSVWMISQCPSNWTRDEIGTKCSANVHFPIDCRNDSKDFVPVIDKETKITYKNRFCAQCHEVQSNSIRFYKAVQVSDFFLYCSFVSWKPPSGAPRRYCLNSLKNESCLNKSSTLEERCLTRPSGIVQAKSKLFFNIYCAMCAGVALDGSIECGPTPNNSNPRPFPPLTVFFDSGVLDPKIPCDAGYVFDPDSRNCKEVLHNKRSVPFHNRYTTTILFTSLSGDTDDNRLKIRKVVELQLIPWTAGLLNIELYYGPASVYSVHITIDFAERKTNLATKSINFNLTIGNISFFALKKAWKPIFCVSIDIYKPGEYIVVSNKDSAVYINKTGEVIPEKDYYFSNQTGTKNLSLVLIGEIHVCREKLSINCSGEFTQLDKHEYVILSNGSLYRNESGMIYDFMVVDGKPAICIRPSATSDKANNLALVILSYVGLSLSVVCLLLVLVTYFLFKELRTLPGVNLTNLSFSLLIAQLLYFAAGATRNRLVCTSVAVLLHYFNLASFMWMSIIAFDTYLTFSRSCRSRQRTNQWKGGFMALGWLPVLAFVVICFALDQSGKVAIGYGGTHHCWINKFLANTIVFVLPVAFSILFNALFYVLTLLSIRKIKKQTRQAVYATNNRKNAVLFFKLAVLMGFTWIFGYLKILFHSNYFDYPFVIFTSLQGVFIAFGFVFTSRVKTMYAQLCSSSKTTPSISSASPCDTRL